MAHHDKYLRTILSAHRDNGEGERLRDLTVRRTNSEEVAPVNQRINKVSQTKALETSLLVVRDTCLCN